MPKMARLGLPRSEKARASPGNERNVESRRNQDSTVVPKMPNGFSGAERSSGIPEITWATGNKPACAGRFLYRSGCPRRVRGTDRSGSSVNRCRSGPGTLLMALELPSRPGSMRAGRARHRPQAARGFERLKTVSRPPVSFLLGAMQFSMMRAA